MNDVCITVMVVVFILAMAYMVTHTDNQPSGSFRPHRPQKNAKIPGKGETE